MESVATLVDEWFSQVWMIKLQRDSSVLVSLNFRRWHRRPGLHARCFGERLQLRLLDRPGCPVLTRESDTTNQKSHQTPDRDDTTELQLRHDTGAGIDAEDPGRFSSSDGPVLNTG